jgi:hypothetical protein
MAYFQVGDAEIYVHGTTESRKFVALPSFKVDSSYTALTHQLKKLNFSLYLID